MLTKLNILFLLGTLALLQVADATKCHQCYFAEPYNQDIASAISLIPGINNLNYEKACQTAGDLYDPTPVNSRGQQTYYNALHSVILATSKILEERNLTEPSQALATLANFTTNRDIQTPQDGHIKAQGTYCLKAKMSIEIEEGDIGFPPLIPEIPAISTNIIVRMGVLADDATLEVIMEPGKCGNVLDALLNQPEFPEAIKKIIRKVVKDFKICACRNKEGCNNGTGFEANDGGESGPIEDDGGDDGGDNGGDNDGSSMLTFSLFTLILSLSSALFINYN